jgi:hypothetical protein
MDWRQRPRHGWRRRHFSCRTDPKAIRRCQSDRNQQHIEEDTGSVYEAILDAIVHHDAGFAD